MTHSKYAAQTYDAVWAMALGVERTEIVLNRENASLAQYTHKRKDIAAKLMDQMRLLRFIGVSVSNNVRLDVSVRFERVYSRAT